MKKTILIDLDGVLNTYNGKYIANYIPPIRSGAIEFIKELSEKFTIKIFTSRNKLQVSKWLIDNDLSKYVEDVTDKKEPSWLIIDDRCLNFEGNYANLIEKINNFKPWYRD